MSQDFDLALSTLWFTKTPPKFPVPSMLAKGPCTSTYSWSWEQDFSGTRKILICAVRFTETLASTKVRVAWQDADPVHTVSAKQIHISPPPPLSEQDLIVAHQTYGQNIAIWAEAAIDTTVGDGECWTLVQHALLDLANTYRQHGRESPMISQGRTHGVPILVLQASTPGSNAGLFQLADVRRGDILEMKSAHFRIVTPPAPAVDTADDGSSREEERWGRWQKGGAEKNIRLAHHTAVVVGVEGDVLRVVEQNGSVALGVGLESYDLTEMVKGEMGIFRVVGESWLGELEASWEE